MKLPDIKIKSFPLIPSLVFLLVVAIAVVFVPNSSWKKIFSGNFNNFATVFSSTPNSTDQQPDTTVDIIIPDTSGGVYVGGNFSQLGTTPVLRHRLAHIFSDGSVDPNFDPNVNGEVFGLLLSTTTNILYIAGSFTQVGTTSINHLAAVDATDGSVITTFNPNLNGDAYVMALASSTLYIGGIFTFVDSVFHTYLSAVDANDGSLITAFSHDANSGVYSFALSPDSSTLYVGGAFSTIGGITRRHIAAIDVTTAAGTLTPFDPGTAPAPANQGQVYALAISPDGNTLYLGGDFNGVNSVPRNLLAAVDTSTGSTTSFNPSPDDQVFVLALSGNILYFGGVFTTIAGIPYSHIAAAHTSDGSIVTSFTPDINSDVYAIAISSSNAKLYVGGIFVQINSVIHSYFASFPVFVPPAAQRRRIAITPTAQETTSNTSTTTGLSLTLNAVIVDESGAPITDRGFKYGFTTSYGSVASSTGTFSSGLFSETLTGLLPNTTYHYQAFAIDSNGLITSSDFTFVLLEDGSLASFVTLPLIKLSAATSTTGTTTATTTFKYIFTKNLRYGNTSSDVKILQQFLNYQGYLLANTGYGAPNEETNYFGPRTRNAVIRFQEANFDSILRPLNLIRGTGNFYEYSRARANAILNQ
jgi:hypothetical protein